MKDLLKIKKTVDIRKWLDVNYISAYVINEDLTIDVMGDVTLRGHSLLELPEFINFNKITNFFSIGDNWNFKSTRGFPLECGVIYCATKRDKSLLRPEGYKGIFKNKIIAQTNSHSEITTDGTITDGTYEEYLKWKNKNES